jgi:hypothetical protein
MVHRLSFNVHGHNEIGILALIVNEGLYSPGVYLIKNRPGVSTNSFKLARNCSAPKPLITL